jgi:hypothetical protein
MHAHEDPPSHSEAESDRAGRGERSRHSRPSARELARLRLKKVAAYVSVDELSVTQQDGTDAGVEDDVSSDTKRKRKQRQADEAANRHQFSVKMPKDDPVLKETIKMVAATLAQDREFHRTWDALSSDPSLREIIDYVASSLGDTALIAKAARTGGLLQMAKVADADSELAQCLAQSVGESALLNSIRMVAVALAEDREFYDTLNAFVSNPSLREIVDCAASAPGDADLIAKAARTGGLLQMAKVVDSDCELAQCLAQSAGDNAVLNSIKMAAMAFQQDREFQVILDAFVSNPSLREIVVCAALAPGDAALIAKAARTGGLSQMAMVADANGELAQCLAQLAGDAVLLEATSELVRTFNEVAADRSAEESLQSATAAMRDPAATLKFCEVRKRNGIRARLLDWILGPI